jgi:hypothetical protein
MLRATVLRRARRVTDSTWQRQPLAVCDHCCHALEGIAYATPDVEDEEAPWVRVCHPDSRELVNCYRAITVHGHPARRCRDCIDLRVFIDGGYLPTREETT